MLNPKSNDKRVGASVALPPPTAMGPIARPYGPGIDAIAVVPPYGGCPVYPPVPPPPLGFGPIVLDDRIRRRRDRRRDSDSSSDEDNGPVVAVSASIVPGQTISPGQSIVVPLGSLNFSEGGATISGNNLVLPKRGIYTITASITLQCPPSQVPPAPSNLSLSLVGGVLGAGVIEGSSIEAGVVVTLSGTLIVQAPNRNTNVSFQISNTGAIASSSATIISGIVGARL